jgi:hypothetical protein
MEGAHIATTEAPSSTVPVGLVQLPLGTPAPLVSAQVPYPATDVAAPQFGFWQSMASDDTPRAGPQGGVHALFNLDVKTEAPFPTNWFTVADHSNLTNRRVNLPLPDCKVFVSDCQDLNVLNQLDGFNMQPRLSIPFDGPIDVHSVNSQDLFLINLGDTVDGREHGDHVVGINQIVWDPGTNALHVESDQLLDQHTRYALIMTNGIQDVNGHPVQASEAFRNFRHEVRGEYKHELLEAIHAVRRLGIHEQDMVDASVFTTESATAILEKIRDQIHAATPAPADFNLGLNGERTVFHLDDVTTINWEQQTGNNPPSFTPTDIDLHPLRDLFPGAVSKVAFGKYFSPDYEVHPGEFISPIATRTGSPVVQRLNEIYFNLFLPSGAKPVGGWPVAIFGHGGLSSKNDGPSSVLRVTAMLAAHGIASVGINMVGAGFGPLGTLTVNQAHAERVGFSAGGRGIDQDDDGMIGPLEGLFATPPQRIIYSRDGFRQTVADLMQLVRVIEVGIDVDGDGTRALDPSRVYYSGHSLGGVYGTEFLAVEPDVRAGVLNAGGAVNPEFSGKSTIQRPGVGGQLRSRSPSLINPPGVVAIDGVNIGAPYFHESIPLRDGRALAARLENGTSSIIQSPVVNTVAGAMKIQEVIDNYTWVSLAGDALGYAPHLRKDPLPGMSAKSLIFQFAKGDWWNSNPASTALLRAGDLAERASYYRHDLAFAEDPAVLQNPHFYMMDSIGPNPLVAAIALGAQEQIATFFDSDGKMIIHPEPARFFEVPIKGPLPEELNWIP